MLTLCTHAQTLKQGDHLRTEFNKIGKPYYFKAPNFTAWAEGANMLLIGDKPNLNDCDFVFLALHDTSLVGVFRTKAPNEYLFDTEGNSILGKPSKYFTLPLWVVKKNTKVLSSDKAILTLLDKMYEKTLQADNDQLDEATTKEYQQYRSNTSLLNRHIALLFDNYQTIVMQATAKGEQAPTDICIRLIKALSGECISVYSNIGNNGETESHKWR